jgi:gliding motility-associated-like protein
MIKKISLIVFSLTVLFATQVKAQTVVAGINPTFLSCGGGNVDLTALGNSTVPVFGDDFNNGGVAAGWAASAAAQFNNPCGASVDGSAYLWMGNGTAAPREMTTAPMDVSCGGTVCFDFKMSIQGQGNPCEGPDLLSEGVALQCSTDGGTTWTDFAYFEPGGNIQVTQTVGGGGTNGASAFTSWANYCFTIPPGCETGSTQFQLHQYGSSGAIYDHWGIDNFYVYANPCAPYYYDWDHIPGAPDAQDVSTNVTQTTTFEVCYTNGITSVCDQVTVIVETIDITSLVIGTEPCLGDNTGSVSVTVTGGAAPYTYNLAGPTPGSNGSGNFTNLAPGNYTITISDNGSCVVDSSFTIAAGPACCTLTATAVDALCFSGSTGSATANPANGVAPYSYQWDAGTGNQTTQTANNLPAGNYNVMITDFNGCQSNVNIVVGQPVVLNTNATPTDALCNGACDGQIVIAAPTGGTAPFTYNIGGGVFGGVSTFTGLCAGNYNLIAQDFNGCQVVMSNIAIAEPTDLTLFEVSTVPATCGALNGELTVVAGGGTPVYSYETGGTVQGSPDFTGLAAGVHIVTVTDFNGCTETVNITVSSAAGPAPFVDSQAPVTCFGGLNGSVTIGVVGGQGPYQFNLDNLGNQASNTFQVSSGSHTVVVTDANGCTGDVNFNIAQPTALTYNTVIVDATCNGVCNGTVTVNASNATPPYMYSDDNGLTYQAGTTLIDLCAGNVNIVVQDNNGCLANSVEVVGQPTAVNSVSAFVEPSCNGLSDGEISFVPGGGTPLYTFSVDGGTSFSGANPQLGIAAGDYDLVVQDANGCEFAYTITVSEPPPFDFLFIANNPSNCGANDGSFEIIATNGLAPYDYSIDGGTTQQIGGFFGSLFSGLYSLHVTDANGCIDEVFSALSDNVMTTQVDFEFPTTCKSSCDGFVQVSQNNGAPPFTYTINTGNPLGQATGDFGGLCAGQHFITIEDFGLCIGIEEVNIIEPDTITYIPVLTHITCPVGSDGIIDFGAATGGTSGPYTYSIDGGVNFQPGAVFAGLTSGDYDLVAMDGNGCLGELTITITEPPAWDVVVNFSDLTCFQNNTGFIQVVGDGATAPYSYDVNGTVNANGIFISLAAQNYNITVTDANLCPFTTTQLLSEPAQLTGVYVGTDALCNAAADGEIDVTAGGGTAPYLYSSNNGIFQQSGNLLAGLIAGCYDVQIEDVNGCFLTSNECIGEPTQLTMTMVMTPATCNADNATLDITAAGGTIAYSYSNNGGTSFQAGNVFDPLAAANYVVVIEDNNGCQIDSLITLVADDLPVIDNVVSTNPACFGDANGEFTVTSSGGVGVHGYSLNPAGPFVASGTFTGLADGVYDVYVEDANLCVATQQITLTEPSLLTYGVLITDLLCNGDFSGVLDLTANGGTSPYQFSIDNGTNFQGGGLFSFIAAADYNIVVQDDNGCQAIGIETVNEPDVLVFDLFDIVDPTCFDDCDGTVTTTMLGGTPGFVYNWSNALAGNTDANALAICDGAYSLTVTDLNGCQVSNNFNLTEPAPVQFPGALTTDVLCNGDLTGTITVGVPTIGVAPFQYSINNGTTFQPGNVFGSDNDPLLQTIGIGNYDIVIEDNNGCTAGTNTTIYQPDPLSATVPSDGVVCFGADVNIQTFVEGGTQPYNFNWSSDLNGVEPTTQVFVASITLPISYAVIITDDNGCVLNVIDTYDLAPLAPLTVDAGPDQLICPGGTANLLAVGAGGELIDYQAFLAYSYSWDTGVAADTVAAISVSPLVQTTYTITLADNCGDVVTDDVIIGLYQAPSNDFVGGGNGCAPDTMAFVLDPVAVGSTVLWDFGNGVTSTNASAMAIYPNPGCYDVTLTVTSDQGCIVSQTYVDLVCIHEDPIPGFYMTPNSPSILDPTVSIVDYSENAVSYNYTFGGYGGSSEPQPSMTFPIDEEATVIVCQYIVSAEGCTAEICVPVDIHEEVLFYVPNIFTPDGDDYNETFFPVFTSGVDPFDYHLTIFNRYGETIFESYNFDTGWSGHYGSGGLVKDGVYIWQIEFGEKLTDKKQTHRGHVTVLK